MDQNDPIQDSEYILRRVLNNPDYCNPSKKLPIARLAFRPTPKDTNGLSVFRKLFISAPELAYGGKNSKGYYVSQIIVINLVELSLTVIPDPQDDQPAGHALIPELICSTGKEEKRKSKELQIILAELASNNKIFGPYIKDLDQPG